MLRQELRDHVQEQHGNIIARRSIVWTEADTENTGVQELGSDLDSAASPNVGSLVTSAGALPNVPAIPSIESVTAAPTQSTAIITTTTPTVTTATHREAPLPGHEDILTVTEVRPPAQLQITQEPATGYREIDTRPRIGDMGITEHETLPDLRDVTLTQGLQECVRDPNLSQLRNLEQSTRTQPEEDVVATPTEPTPRNLLSALETASVAETPVVTSIVTRTTPLTVIPTPSNFGQMKNVDGEGTVEVRDKAPRVSANDTRTKRGSTHERRPKQVPRTSTSQSNKVDKELQVLYRKLRYNIFCIHSLHVYVTIVFQIIHMHRKIFYLGRYVVFL